MSESETTYGLGDYIGDLLAFGVSQKHEVEGWDLRNDAVFTEAHGSTLLKRISSVMEDPQMFAIWSLIELVLTIAWMHNPWPFPTDSVTKHPGALEIFVLLYFTVSFLYFLFFKSKQAGWGEAGSETDPGVYGDKNGFLGGLAAKVYSTLGSMVLFILAIVGVFFLIRRFDFLYYIVTYAMNICIIILAIALIYLVAKPMFKNWKFGPGNVLGIIWDFILFVPCLFISAIEWFLRQESGKKLDGSPDPFYARHKLVWIVLLVEAVVIALRFAIPVVFNKLVTHDGNHLLGDPVYLNTEHMLGTYEDLHGKASTNHHENYKYHYAISAWIYINPQPPSTSAAYSSFAPLLSYGKKPVIEYNGRTNVLRVATESGKDKDNKVLTTTLASIPNVQYQKWNNFVINYDGANMDVFLNAELIGTQPNIAPYMSLDDVVAGSHNGIHGGICNVVYYDHTLSRGDIALTYRTLRDKTTPIL